MKRLLLLSALLLSLAPFSPAAAKTDTLYFEFALEAGADSATIEYAFTSAVLPGIRIEYNDGQEHPQFTPTASGKITVKGNGHGRIYYTYEQSEGYSAYFSSHVFNEDIRVRTLSGVYLTSLDVHACTALTYLDCSNNQLTALDVSANTALKYLICSYNQLTALDVSANTELVYLSCSYNQLTSLDVSSCTRLEQLQCDNNQLTGLDVSHNPDLIDLNCSYNQLTGLDVSHNSDLIDLNCSYNQLTGLDVSHNPDLIDLNCSYNQLTSLDLSQTSLEELSCGNNQLALSTLYGIFKPRYNFGYQTDTLTVGLCRALDLSSEKTLGGTTTTFELKDKDGNSVSSDAYTENDFRFQFHNPATYTLTLQNTSLPNTSMTYHITAEECKTDTLYFEFALETSSARIWYDFSDDVFPDIEMEYYDGEEYAKFKPTATESITVNGNGYGRIYYTYEESTGYSAGFSSSYSISDIRVTLSRVKLTSLDVHNCTALTELDCYNNQLTSLNVSGCTALTNLNCRNNQLTDLDVSDCTSLKELHCYQNKLTTLDVSHNTLLEDFSCSYNQLTSLDVSHNTRLGLLQCTNNQLTGLDVSHNTLLEELSCSNNQLTVLDVSANTKLAYLYCNNNQLTVLDVSANTELVYLFCNNNQLTSWDVSSCTRLDQLQCANNQLTSLDVSGCTALKTLNCGNNHLPLSTLYGIYAQRADWSGFYVTNQTDTVSLASCQALNLGTEKMLGGNPTTFELKNKDGDELAVTTYTEDSISFQFNEPFTGTLKLQNDNLPDASMTYHITAAGCASEPPTPTTSHTDTLYFEFALETSSALIWYEFSDDVFPGIEMEYYDGEEYAKFKPTATESITVNGNGYGRIYYTYEESTGYSAGFSSFYSISDIDIRVTLSGVKLTSLDVHACAALTDLECYMNQLTSLNVSGCTKLTSLGCGNNQLTDLDVSHNPDLKNLYCGFNQLTSLDVSHNTLLEELSCFNNQLTSLDVSHNTLLEKLSCSNNQLTGLDVSHNTLLEKLSCSNNQLTGLDVSECTALKDLYCNNNQLTSWDVSSCTRLEQLQCANNQLTSLDVSGCTALKTLNCATNHLPLSTLYGIYAQRADWSGFYAANQTDTLALASCVALDLGTEKEFDGTVTTDTLRNAANQIVSSEAYTQNNFSFLFKDPFIGTLTLQNTSLPDASMTYHITAEGCASEPPTPTTSHTDTIRFDVEKTSNNPIQYKFSDKVKAGIEIEWIPADGASTRFTPNSNNYSQTLSGNGQVYIYYTHASDAEPYSLGMRRGANGDKDIDVKCAYHTVNSLNVSGCTALKNLVCNSNQLTALDVSDCAALTELQCDNNQLTSLNVSGCTSLEKLWCYENQLTALDVSANAALKLLICSDNQLSALDVSANTKLKTLWCYSNQLTALDVSADTALTELWCYGNQLTSLDVSGCTVLTDLDCHLNQLTRLNVSGCTALTILSCGNNHLPLSTLYGLYTQRADWNLFYATNQTYTLAVAMCLPFDLSSEKEFDRTATTFVLKDAADNDISTTGCTENDFKFQFHTPATYTLTLQNTSVPNASMTYYLTVEECLSVSVSSNNEAWGWATKTGDGAYAEDSSVTIIATPREGYRFVNWTREGVVFSTEAAHTFAVTENLILVANFEEIPPVVVETFTLSVSANNDAWGSVSQSGNGTYEKDASVTLTATPAEGYRFVNWTREGAIFCHQADTTFAVTENLTLVANFEEIPPVVEDDFTIILTPNNPAWGRVLKTGNCTYGEGEEITILALPFAGCRFVNWTKADGTVFATDSLYTFKVSESLELTANFERIPDAPEVETFTVNVSANNDAWGSVSQSGEGTYEKDSSATITATPAEGYRFVNWTREGAIFGTASDTTFVVTEDLTLVANFEKIPDGNTGDKDEFYVYVKDHTIYLSEKRGKVQVFNVIGQCLYSGRTTAIHVRHNGVYIVRVGDKNYKVLVL